jgi:hypothetical protein
VSGFKIDIGVRDAAHKSWSVQLHHDNLVALAETRADFDQARHLSHTSAASLTYGKSVLALTLMSARSVCGLVPAARPVGLMSVITTP